MPTRGSAKAKAESTDALPVLAFTSAAQFESFLEKNHSTLPGLQLKLAKKASGVQSVTSSEAIEVALCYGWIDGQANKFDDKYWLVRYTPRRAKSVWSQKNVNTVVRLIEEDRMHESGLKAVEAAKQDGRWDRAYAGSANISIPNDFAEKLNEVSTAKTFFEGLNKTERYSILWRIETSNPQNRTKRVEALVQMLAAGNLPAAPTKVKVDPKETKVTANRVSKRSTKSKGK